MENTEPKTLQLSEDSCPSIHFGVFLSVLFILSFAVRFALSLSFRHGPTIQIDESLYINIAKSLAAGNGISYRSQPVPYPYIFYPLLLAPLYLFPLPFDLYRVLQLWNALLICSAAFPVFLFARDFTGSSKKALLAAALTLLMPDMMIAGFLMAESVVWPLSLWLVFFACRRFRADASSLRYGVLTGLFTALLFWAKPGAVVVGLVLLISALFLGGEPSRLARRRGAVAGLAVCAVCVFMFYALYTLVFGYEFSFLGLYERQVAKVSAVLFAAAAECSVFQLLLFSLACGGIFFVIPYACRRGYASEQRSFLCAFSAALLFLAVGTAVFVDLHTWSGFFTRSMLHLRYMAMYLPVMLVFSLGASGPEDESSGKCLLYGTLAMAVLTVFPGAFVGFAPGDSTYMDSLALSAWLGYCDVPALAGIIGTGFSALFLLALVVQIKRGRRFSLLMKESLIFFILFLLYNNIWGYVASDFNKDSNHYGQDAVEMNTILETLPREVLIVTQQNYDETVSYCLEARLRKPMQQVPVDTFLSALAEEGGVYKPFVPADCPPNVGNRITPDTDTFLFGVGVTNHLEFSEAAALQKTGRGWFTLATVPQNTPLLASALTGLDLDTLHKDSQATLRIFDESRFKGGRLTLHLYASAAENSAELEVYNAGQTQLVTLSEKPKTCLISLRPGETLITARNGDAVLSSYSTN